MHLLAFARTTLDGALDVVFGHIAGFCFLDRKAERRIEFGIRTGLGRDDELADDLCPRLRTRSICFSLLVLDGTPFIMT